MAIDLFPLSNSTGHFINFRGVANESGAPPPVSEVRPGLTRCSIFHEPWWLNAVTGGDWHLAKVVEKNEVLGEMPYTLVRKGFWNVSEMPLLTRCLGPVIRSTTGSADEQWRHRFNVCNKLIQQLPACALFEQLMDPSMSEAEAIAFTFSRFKVFANFTLRISPQQTEADTWAHMRPNTRNVIRRASEQLTVKEILSADEFVRFYDANLAARQQRNMYGSSLMRTLLGEVMERRAGKLLGCYDKDGTLQAAITVVSDNTALYYFLSSRKRDSHSGAISVLIWTAIRLAHERKLVFDFDGIASLSILMFLSGFGGTLVRRFEIRRMRSDYAAFRKLHRSTQAIIESAGHRLHRAKDGDSAAG
ncbi:GNAT family N-acetyltransferase [Paraburkholderia susongensis]|uniref:Acetyltransferase (GNAT) domain-containing protein n=1 Tax=Paraburkholderia susongensis TaxID=1515439 RepID=A0A1X7KS56_9BURK|nr:GNAT family N-acetyltransferase [Paraburkholderia susongensis]SMG44096.1 Acetyltransferase (GNAT) domain-containing protein [Paraburkholderia susongensis]